MLLEGLFLPITTPFFPDGRLHLRKLRQNVAHYALTPAAGMVVLGPGGEPSMLSDTETRAVLAEAMEAAAETKVMVAGVARSSVQETLVLIEDAAAMGYDAALVTRPALELQPAELKVYFEVVADRSALPILLGGVLPMDLVAQLASHPRVLGYVHHDADASGLNDLLHLTAEVKRIVTVTPVFAAVTGRMLAREATEGLVSAASLGGGTVPAVGSGRTRLKTRTKVVGFQVLAGGTEGMLDALEAGAVGAMPPFAAAAPQGCYEVYAAWKDGDAGLALEKQERLVAAARLVEGTLGVAGVKYGCDLNGYAGGSPRLPLLGLPGEQRLAVEQVMAGLKS